MAETAVGVAERRRTRSSFAERVAHLIPGISSERVTKFLRDSKKAGLMFHGVKYNDLFQAVNEDGVAPLTPEGGNVSYWTAGERLFSDPSLTGGWFGFDSTFFDWSSGRGSKNGATKTIVVASRDSIKNETGFSPDMGTYPTVPVKVPRKAVQIFRVEAPGQSNDNQASVNRTMFEFLEGVAAQGVRAGGLDKALVNRQGKVDISRT